MDASPRQIGAYRIETELGRGGMGVVYRGVDSRLGRTVAIKALPEALVENAEFMARFEREARTLAALNHPNIGGIHDLEDEGGRKYLVLEFVDGETLSERIARGPLRVGETLEIGSQIAQGLSAAHDAGFVHRDLKPANIKIDADGTVKILDFGLARSEEVTSGNDLATERTQQLLDVATSPGTVLGTAPYMSPEQARGEFVDRRTDLWGLGVLLYQCLTGSNPFARDSAAECLAATLNEEPNLDRLPPATPREIVALIRRCLCKDRRWRQRDAGDCFLILHEARDALFDDAPTTSRQPDVTEERLRIDDEVCRSLDRRGFDPLLPGWEMRYADNNRDSEVLVVWIPSIGGDHTTTQWRELISTSPHRMVVVTPVGMEPGVQNRPVVSLENQLALFRALTRHLHHSLRPKRTIISGLSCGSIMALRCAAGDVSGELFDGILTIDADLQESDCFLTRLLAGLDASSAKDVMEGLRSLSGSCGTIPEWLVLHQHMIEWVHKVQDDFSPLIRQGRDLSEAYEGVHTGADSPFVGFLRDALERVGTVHCVFHDSTESRRILGEIRMMHLDDEVLGPGFIDESIAFIPVSDHTGMMRNERLLEQLAQIVDLVEG